MNFHLAALKATLSQKLRASSNRSSRFNRFAQFQMGISPFQ